MAYLLAVVRRQDRECRQCWQSTAGTSRALWALTCTPLSSPLAVLPARLRIPAIHSCIPASPSSTDRSIHSLVSACFPSARAVRTPSWLVVAAPAPATRSSAAPECRAFALRARCRRARRACVVRVAASVEWDRLGTAIVSDCAKSEIRSSASLALVGNSPSKPLSSWEMKKGRARRLQVGATAVIVNLVDQWSTPHFTHLVRESRQSSLPYPTMLFTLHASSPN